MFSDIKLEAIDKLLKIKLYLNEIKVSLPSPPVPPSEFQNSLKGLFFVYLYGIFESIVTKTIARTIEELNLSGVKISQCKFELLTLILSPQYDALYGAGESTKWPKRWNIGQKFLEDNPLSITTDLFPTDGKNIHKQQLESLYKSFGNAHTIFPRIETQGHLEDLVRNRNFIAHGDMLPHEIGRNYSIADLEKIGRNIDELCTYFMDSYEEYIFHQEYLKV